MPLRDALRGMATIVDTAEAVLAPAAHLLPEPLEVRLRDAMASVERAGRNLIHPAIESQAIAATARFLLGDEESPATAPEAASVFVYAWETLKELDLAGHFLISETLTADVLSRASDGDSGARRAALMTIALRNASVIGPAPGLVSANAEQREISTGLLAIMVWVLANRPEDVAEERMLLGLSHALVTAEDFDLERCFSDADAMSEILADTPEHL